MDPDDACARALMEGPWHSRQRLLIGDARDLSAIADASVGLVLTSPPYPMIAMWDELFAELAPASATALFAGDGRRAFEAMHAALDLAWAEIARVLIPGGIAVINIGDALRRVGASFRLWSNHSRILSSLERLGFDLLPDVLWRKPTTAPNKFMGSGMLPGGAYVTYEHEYLLVARRGNSREFVSPGQKRARRQSAYFFEERNQWFSDLWSELKGERQAQDLGSPRTRSAAFPFELAYRIVHMYSVRGDLVLDPFVGTGTTLAATLAAGRDGLGIERDQAFVPIIARSLREALERGQRRAKKRLADHEDFLMAYRAKGREPKHFNAPHRFSVVTGQESDLEVWSPIALDGSLEEAGVLVRYGLTESE